MTQGRSSARFMPDISILMTAFNTGAYLREAIDSVLYQETTRTWELLFVDDGSTDSSLAIAQAYAAMHPARIRVFQHPGGINCGISASRNLAMRHARAPLLAFLDSDDVWLPHHLEAQLTLLNDMPHVAMVYASAERWVYFAAPFNEAAARGATWGSNYLPPLVPAGEASGLLRRGQLLQWFRADESLVPCICTVLVRTKAARAVGGFCDAFRGVYDDQAFHAKIALNYPVYAHDICVARYRQHALSCCARARTSEGENRTERRRFTTFLRNYVKGSFEPA